MTPLDEFRKKYVGIPLNFHTLDEINIAVGELHNHRGEWIVLEAAHYIREACNDLNHPDVILRHLFQFSAEPKDWRVVCIFKDGSIFIEALKEILPHPSVSPTPELCPRFNDYGLNYERLVAEFQYYWNETERDKFYHDLAECLQHIGINTQEIPYR